MKTLTPNKKFLLWAPFFTRSEMGPLEPLVRVAESDEFKDRIIVRPHNFAQYQERGMGNMYASIEAVLKSYTKPDMVLCGFDRPEMMLAAYACYHRNMPIVQIFAGDIAGGAWDDADRFGISNYASLLFTAGRAQEARLRRAMAWRWEMKTADGRCEQPPYIVATGATHFDDMAFVDPAVSDYDLVLYNPPSRATPKDIVEEFKQIDGALDTSRTTIYAATNGDQGSTLIRSLVEERKKQSPATVRSVGNMPRTKFLGYIHNASSMLGNSSCMFYEAPFFNIEVVQVGMRNAFREPVESEFLKPGASRRILSLIIDHLEEEK